MRLHVKARPLVLGSLLVVAAACGGVSSDGDAVPQDPANAQSCADLADIAVASAQRVLDAVGSASVDGPPSPDVEAANNDLDTVMGEMFSGSDLPDCDDEGLERLICERNRGLESFGPVGDGFVAFFFAPPCDEYGNSGDSAGQRDPGPGSDWIDEPLPPLEELVNASNCEDFMRMLVGVENERFRLKEEVTAADDAANNYTHWDFDEYDVFAELQSDVGCGDLEFFTIVENATFARCDRWVAEGHSRDEDPLMLNSEQCF